MRHPAKTLVLFLLAALVGGAAACSKAGAKTRPGRGPTFAGEKPPADLIAVVSARAPQKTVGDVAAYVNEIVPGAGEGVKPEVVRLALAELLDVPVLDGVALDKPMHLLLLSPTRHERPVVLYAAVSDEKALRRAADGLTVQIAGGRALVGAASAVAAVEEFARKGLKDAPAQPTATIFVAPLLRDYRDSIVAAKQDLGRTFGSAGGFGKLMSAYVDGFLAVADQTDRVVFSVAVDKQNAELGIAVVPTEGSAFETWSRAQKPSDYALLTKLPQGRADMVMAGRFDFAPVRPQLIAFLAPFFAELMGAPIDDAAQAKLAALMDSFGGELAASIAMGPRGAMTMTEILTSPDGKKAIALSRELFGKPGKRTVTFLGVTMTIESSFDLAIDGAPAASVRATFDTSGMSYYEREAIEELYPNGVETVMAGAEKHLVLAFGRDPEAGVRRGIAALAGQDTLAPSAGLKRAIADSKKRGESMLMFLDLAAVMRQTMAPYQAKGVEDAPASESGVAYGLGFYDGAAHLRITVPSAHVKELTRSMIRSMR